VDACTSGSEPGALFKLQGSDVEHLPPLAGVNLHAFRWDHALAFARWALKDDYPARIDVYLIEAQSLTVGDPLSPPVERTMHRLADLLLRQLHEDARDVA
jgi:hydrogenase maturation protease